VIVIVVAVDVDVQQELVDVAADVEQQEPPLQSESNGP
jgi:hypothetical protein